MDVRGQLSHPVSTATKDRIVRVLQIVALALALGFQALPTPNAVAAPGDAKAVHTSTHVG